MMNQEAWQRYKANLIERWLESRRVLYARSRNPIHALDAYRIIRADKLDVPGWILELFDQWAEVLSVKRPKRAKEIADALGLGTKAGPSITLQAEKQVRDLRIAERVLGLLDRDPKPAKQDVFDQVGEEFDLSSESVSGIWYKLTRGVKY